MRKQKRSVVFKTTTDSRTYKILQWGCDPYWDEGISYYPAYNAGRKNPIKRLMSYQVRAYRTWKHNRKTQWKI